MLCGTISAVRINIPAGILFIKNVLKHFAVVNSGIRNLVIPDDLVLNIDLNMILITEIIIASFLRPTGIRVFLTFLCVTPVFNWRISCLDSLIFFSGVTLSRHANNCRINDLSLASHKTGFGKEGIELVKQFPGEFMFFQF